MPMNKSKGNMYGWVDYTWNVIKGRCPHDCIYCYMKRFPQKPLRFDEKELRTNLGSGNTIFVGSSCDMWAEEIPNDWILKVLQHCLKYPDNTYLFQSKNPHRFAIYLDDLPQNTILGTTIETNKEDIIKKVSKAPSPVNRYMHMLNDFPRKMVSIEPIMNFDLDIMIRWIEDIEPEFVSIGADSKGHNLPEPPAWKVKALIEELKEFTDVKIKNNLGRLLKESEGD